jgi:hypothetical protein
VAATPIVLADRARREHLGAEQRVGLCRLAGPGGAKEDGGVRGAESRVRRFANKDAPVNGPATS